MDIDETESVGWVARTGQVSLDNNDASPSRDVEAQLTQCREVQGNVMGKTYSSVFIADASVRIATLHTRRNISPHYQGLFPKLNDVCMLGRGRSPDDGL